MNSSNQSSTTRREFLRTSSKLAAASALANVAIPYVHAAGSDLVQVALIGCGGRGGGAAANALSVKRGPVKLVAMADIFPERLASAWTRVHGKPPNRVRAKRKTRSRQGSHILKQLGLIRSRVSE